MAKRVVEVSSLVKQYGSLRAVDDISFEGSLQEVYYAARHIIHRRFLMITCKQKF